MNNTQPLFSVLIAQYNNGKYLQEAVDSVKAQTYNNWEIILVDDCSTDNSKELYKLYAKDSRINIYFNKKNRGCGYTKRRCVELSTGEILGFLDPDDKLAEDALADMVALHCENEDCSLIYSSLYEFNSKNTELIISKTIGKIEDGEDFLINSKKGIALLSTFRRSYYDRTEGIDPKLRTSEDSDLYYKLEEVGNLLYYDKPIYYCRMDNLNSVSIGSVNKVKLSYINMMIASWNGIIRRIASNSPLYLRKKEVYFSQMRNLLDYFICNKQQLYLNYTIRFCYYYLKFNKFSPKGFKHIIKIFIHKYYIGS